jgi:hypothetical protein
MCALPRSCGRPHKRGDRAVKDDNIELLIGFDRGDDLVKLRNRFWSELLDGFPYLGPPHGFTPKGMKEIL